MNLSAPHPLCCRRPTKPRLWSPTRLARTHRRSTPMRTCRATVRINPLRLRRQRSRTEPTTTTSDRIRIRISRRRVSSLRRNTTRSDKDRRTMRRHSSLTQLALSSQACSPNSKTRRLRTRLHNTNSSRHIRHNQGATSNTTTTKLRLMTTTHSDRHSKTSNVAAIPASITTTLTAISRTTTTISSNSRPPRNINSHRGVAATIRRPNHRTLTGSQRRKTTMRAVRAMETTTTQRATTTTTRAPLPRHDRFLLWRERVRACAGLTTVPILWRTKNTEVILVMHFDKF